MIGHISDAETSNENLVVTSQSANFVAWHPETFELEVLFNEIPTNAEGDVQVASMYVTVDDGVEIIQTHYCLMIENGMPRWGVLTFTRFR